jgi:hypothetical protein
MVNSVGYSNVDGNITVDAPHSFSVNGPAQGGSAGGVQRLPVPRQKFGNAPRRVVSNASEHVSEVALLIKSVELSAFDQRVDRGGTVAASIGAGKQIILAADGNAASGLLARGRAPHGQCLQALIIDEIAICRWHANWLICSSRLRANAMRRAR